jgi:hypothetical protein
MRASGGDNVHGIERPDRGQATQPVQQETIHLPEFEHLLWLAAARASRPKP